MLMALGVCGGFGVAAASFIATSENSTCRMSV